ncbi:746_t:CDS:2, partial [Gigaspora margarita]
RIISYSQEKKNQTTKRMKKYFSNNAGQLQKNDYTSSEIQQSQSCSSKIKLQKEKELVLAKEKKSNSKKNKNFDLYLQKKEKLILAKEEQANNEKNEKILNLQDDVSYLHLVF